MFRRQSSNVGETEPLIALTSSLFLCIVGAQLIEAYLSERGKYSMFSAA
jgi:hypothetical protein